MIEHPGATGTLPWNCQFRAAGWGLLLRSSIPSKTLIVENRLMGAWGELAFDNDAAGDWADALDEVNDLSLVEAAFDEVEEVGDEYLEMDPACHALAACEVLARLLGHSGYQSPSTEEVDRWVAAHKLTPSAALLKRALHAIDRILDTHSELRELWDETGEAEAWHQGVADLRRRLRAD
jgi:hypothetical protein